MTQANKLISVHEVRLLLVFQQQPDHWWANDEAAKAAQISPRTARAHTVRLAKIGVLSAEKVFPAYKYRLAAKPGEVAVDYLERWERARESLGLCAHHFRVGVPS